MSANQTERERETERQRCHSRVESLWESSGALWSSAGTCITVGIVTEDWVGDRPKLGISRWRTPAKCHSVFAHDVTARVRLQLIESRKPKSTLCAAHCFFPVQSINTPVSYALFVEMIKKIVGFVLQRDFVRSWPPFGATLEHRNLGTFLPSLFIPLAASLATTARSIQ